MDPHARLPPLLTHLVMLTPAFFIFSPYASEISMDATHGLTWCPCANPPQHRCRIAFLHPPWLCLELGAYTSRSTVANVHVRCSMKSRFELPHVQVRLTASFRCIERQWIDPGEIETFCQFSMSKWKYFLSLVSCNFSQFFWGFVNFSPIIIYRSSFLFPVIRNGQCHY